MGFLAPTLLVLGAAMVVPIVLHLFQRHQGPRVVFPALRYLRRAETEHARRIRLRQWLLMLLRVAVLMLIALAAARPLLRAAGAGHEPTAVAIILDNSMSSGLVSGDRRVLDDLKERALRTLDLAGPEDRFWLIRAGQAWEPALPGDAETTRIRVRETEPTAGAADIMQAVAHARAVLESGAGPLAREIHLLSDLQATNVGGTEPAAGPDSPPLVIGWVRGEPPPNLSVTSVAVGGGTPPTAGQRSTIAARIEGGGRDSVSIRLLIEDRLVAVALARPGDAVLMPFPARPAGLASGWVATDPDALRADDRRAFAFEIRPAPRVALAGRLDLTEQALSVLEDAGRIRRTAASEADVMILPAASGVENVAPGKAVVLLAPDSVLELPAINRRLEAAGIAWRLEPSRLTGEARLAVDSARDDLFRTLARVRVTHAFHLVPQSPPLSDSVLLGLADGGAWAVRGERRGGGIWVLIASSLAESATSLPTSAAMIPLMDRLITTWTSTAAVAGERLPGDEFMIPPDIDTIERPDGVAESVHAGARYRLGRDAGLYLLKTRDSVRQAIVVNAAPAESNVARMPVRSLERRLAGWRVYASDRSGDWAQQVYRGRVGREIWRPLLLAVTALLILETLIAASGAPRRRQATTPTTESWVRTPVPPSE